MSLDNLKRLIKIFLDHIYHTADSIITLKSSKIIACVNFIIAFHKV